MPNEFLTLGTYMDNSVLYFYLSFYFCYFVSQEGLYAGLDPRISMRLMFVFCDIRGSPGSFVFSTNPHLKDGSLFLYLCRMLLYSLSSLYLSLTWWFLMANTSPEVLLLSMFRASMVACILWTKDWLTNSRSSSSKATYNSTLKTILADFRT